MGHVKASVILPEALKNPLKDFMKECARVCVCTCVGGNVRVCVSTYNNQIAHNNHIKEVSFMKQFLNFLPMNLHLFKHFPSSSKIKLGAELSNYMLAA